MTILNDNKIRSLCLTATHRGKRGSGLGYYTKFGEDFYHAGEMWGGSVKFSSDEARVGFLDCLIELSSTEVEEFGQPMITPFEPKQVRVNPDDGEKVISYGTSSMGYDVRLANKFKIFTNIFNALIDPLDMPESTYVDHEGDFVIIPPNSYVLGHTIEYFKIPRDITAVCIGKSTYARAGCIVNVTPIEAGFEGTVVIEIANLTPLPMKVYANQGIAQFLFFKGEPCETSYADRAGKYQGQTGIQTAIV